MDYSSALASAGVSTTTIIVLGVLYKVWTNLKGHRLVSDCCGKMYEVGVDVRDMPPSPPAPGGNQTHLLSCPPKAESFQSPPVTVPEPSNNHRESRRHIDFRIRLPPQVEEAESAHESVVVAISDTKQSEQEKESYSSISLPRLSAESVSRV